MRCDFADVTLGNSDGGERGVQVFGSLDIADSDDGNIVRHFEIHAVDRGDRRDGHVIARNK